jgi:hypothetical protein
LAQTPPERPEQQRPEQSKSEMTFMGEVVSVDATAKTLTVRESSASSPSTPSTPPAQPAGKTMTFNFDSSTKITSKADKPASPETPPAAGQPSGKNLEAKDLKAGDRVTVKYTSEGGKHVAKSIEVGKKATT